MTPKAFRLLIVGFLFLSFSAIYGYAEDQTSQASDLPKIVYIEGSVSVILPGENAVFPQKGMALQEGTVIKTADQSYCDIAFDKDLKNIVSVGPNSDLKIGKDFKQINISKGRIFSQLKGLEPGSQFEVVTPQAIAGVRGTAWESVIDLASKFNVKDSIIYVKGVDKKGKATGKNDVAKGYSLTVDPSGWLGELVALTKEDEERMENWSNRIERALSSASSKGNCSDLIEGYQGASANLFGQVMDCEVGDDETAFASSSEGLAFMTRGDVEQGIGGDITQTTFALSPIVSSAAPSSTSSDSSTSSSTSSSPVKPPHWCCPATNPQCSC